MTDIPWKLKKTKKKEKKLKEYWIQDKCGHIECLEIENQKDFIKRRNKNLKIFKGKKYEDVVNFVFGCVDWPIPSKTSTIQKWIYDDGYKKKNQYPQSRIFKINNFGFGSTKVCIHYFKWYFCIGSRFIHRVLRKIWECRVDGSLFYVHESSYGGYQNKLSDHQKWEYSALNFFLQHIDLSREHWASKKKGLIYMELKDGQRMTLKRAWNLYIQITQNESYQHYVVNKLEDDPNIKKPFPSCSRWVRRLREVLPLKPDRLKQDQCSECGHLSTLKQEIVDEKELEDIEVLLSLHEKRWKFTYSANKFINKNCIKCWSDMEIDWVYGVEPMIYSGTSIHIMADYGLDRPEIITPHSICYFKKKIQMKHLNVIYNDERYTFVWSEMNGGKAIEETWQSYWYLFTERCVGAERLYLTCDGAMISYDLLMLLMWVCNPKNPKRKFLSFTLLSLEQGHSYIPADTLDYRITTHYNKINTWTTCAERVQYINAHTDINMVQLFEFMEIPVFFSDIYKGKSSWKDQFKKPANIRDDKPLMFKYGIDEEYDQNTDSFPFIEHYDELWMQIGCDPKIPHRKLKIFKNTFNEKNMEDFVEYEPKHKPRPKIKMQTVMDTRSIIRQFVPSPRKEALFEYYNPVLTDDDDKEDMLDERLLITPKRSLIKMKRRLQFLKMMKTNKIVELTPYERKKRNQNKENEQKNKCDIAMKWKISELNMENKDVKIKNLKPELKAHRIKIGNKKKHEMIEDLLSHYRDKALHPEDYTLCPLVPTRSMDIPPLLAMSPFVAVPPSLDISTACSPIAVQIKDNYFQCLHCHGVLLPCSERSCSSLCCFHCSSDMKCRVHSNHN